MSTSIDFHTLFSRQIIPVFDMIDAIIKNCTNEQWKASLTNKPIWQHIYHSLFWTNVWLRDWQSSFQYPPFHLDNARDLIANDKELINQNDLLQYSSKVRHDSIEYIMKMPLDSFPIEVDCNGKQWTIMEIIINQIRHMQHHIGSIHSILRSMNKKPPKWIGYNENGLTLSWYNSYLLNQRRIVKRSGT